MQDYVGRPHPPLYLDLIALVPTDAPGGASASGSPTARDDVVFISSAGASVLDVLANDSDPDGRLDPGSVAIAQSGAGLAVVHPQTGVIRFTPSNDPPEVDAFRYTVADHEGLVSDPATVFVHLLSAAETEGTVIVAAGDIACTPSTEKADRVCHQDEIATLIDALAPAAVLALGDTQYEDGEPANYLAAYDPSWGRFKDITYPVGGEP